MQKILNLITEEMIQAFQKAGYDEKFAKVTLSNRPDLCEYQCNGAMAAAKTYKKAPIMIANAVVEAFSGSEIFSDIQVVNPGFINLKLNPEFLAAYLDKMQADENLSVEKAKEPKKIIIDYGGPNVAKPLHVGHLRSAIIGESIKRMGRFLGHEVIGDVHLGDWGLQMGLIIVELKKRKPAAWFTSMRATPGASTRRWLPSRSASWRRFIPRPALTPKSIRNTKRRPCRQPTFCSTATEAIRPS